MSLQLSFEPHSWYRGFAIKHDLETESPDKWLAFTADGNTYRVVMLNAQTLQGVKELIKDWRMQQAKRDAYNRRLIGEIA